MTHKSRVPNRLAQEKSPYLLKHVYNPVNWFPWVRRLLTKPRRKINQYSFRLGIAEYVFNALVVGVM